MRSLYSFGLQHEALAGVGIKYSNVFVPSDDATAYVCVLRGISWENSVADTLSSCYLEGFRDQDKTRAGNRILPRLENCGCNGDKTDYNKFTNAPLKIPTPQSNPQTTVIRRVPKE